MVTKRRRIQFCALSTIALLLIGPYAVSRARSPGRAVRVFSGTDDIARDSVSSVRILTFNIAHGRGATDDNWEGSAAEKRARIEQIARLIADAEADVVILNEVDFCSTWSGHQNQAQAIAASAGYPYRVEQRNLDFRLLYGSWKFGNAVLSRFPIMSVELLELPTLRSPERWLAGCKQGVVCTLQLSELQQVRIVAVHLEHRSEDVRADSASVIVEVAEASSIPLIAAGDFNSAPSGSPGSERGAGGKNAMEVLQDSGRFESPAQLQAADSALTYSSTEPTSVIDWVLIPAGWRFADYRVLQSELSDHRPVTADVLIPESSVGE